MFRWSTLVSGLVGVALAALAVGGCSASLDSDLTTPCAAGAQQSCECPDGAESGVQVCGASGGFLACICGQTSGSPGPASGTDAAVTSCVPDEAVCEGKCGDFTESCGTVAECGGCPSGATCGGGGTPNVCGVGTCTPDCAGKACSASDGCGGVCGMCAGGAGDAGAPITSSVLLFGGLEADDAGLTDESDTWSMNQTSWRPLGVTAPTARDSAAMAALNGQVILFGGIDQTNAALGDTWAWSGTTWTRLDVPGPSPRAGSLMAPLGGKLVLFGGQDMNGVSLADTWTWDGQAWTELTVTGPSKRQYGVMAPLNGQLVLFGGVYLEEWGYNVGVDLADIWSFDGTAWAQLSSTGPSARHAAVMAPLNGKLFLFGGLSRETDDSDTWSWDGATWTQLGVVDGPSPRDGAAMAPLNGKLFLFGGENTTEMTGNISDTWTWDGATWTQLTVDGPAARHFAMMASF